MLQESKGEFVDRESPFPAPHVEALFFCPLSVPSCSFLRYSKKSRWHRLSVPIVGSRILLVPLLVFYCLQSC